MMDLDRWQEILFTLSQHKLRTALTALGVFWGIFMLVALLGAGKSLQNGALKGFGGYTNTIFLWSSGTTQIPYDGFETGRRINLEDGDLAALRALPEMGISSSVNELGGWQVAQYVVRKDKSGTFGSRGVEPAIFKLGNFKILRGRALNALDFKERRKVIVIGPTVKDILFEPEENPIGQDLKVGGVNFTVVGVYDPDNNSQDDLQRILMPNSTLRTTFNQMNYLGHIQMAPKPGIRASVLQEKALALVKERHHVSPKDNAVFGTANVEEQYDKVLGLFTGIRIFSWVVAIFTIIAGVVGVGNIMLIVVKERTREIGIHKALGATPWNIVTAIVQETLVLTVVSGYLGLVAGVFLMEFITKALAKGGGGDMFSSAEVDLHTAIWALVTLVIAGTLAALLPASKAARVDPIVALQDE